MNTLILAIQLILITSTAEAHKLTWVETGSFSKYVFSTVVCPGANDTNASIVEDFLTKPEWAERRAVANAESLSVSHITLLTDAVHSSACSSFNDIFEEALEEKNSLGEPANNISYHKAGNLYFVVITPRQSDNPDYITSGVRYITIYDQNMDLIKAYAF